MDSQAQYEELRALLQSVLRMLGEVLKELKMGARPDKDERMFTATGEPVDPEELIDD